MPTWQNVVNEQIFLQKHQKFSIFRRFWHKNLTQQVKKYP